jgi:3-oxoacyl-[acyl-carrier protein] reductase
MNNAGTTQLVADGNLDALSADDFLHIYSVNVVGAYQMTRAVAPHMKAQGRGSVVNTSSIAGVMGIGSSIAYAASKGAMNTMTLSLARLLAPEIRVNAIAPGFITGRWWLDKLGQEGYDKMVAGVEASVPLNHAGTPEDMAEAALFLLASSANITGEILISDGGNHLGGAPLIAR